MCISIAPIEFAETVTGLYEAADGKHVVFYQNKAGKPKRFEGVLSAAPHDFGVVGPQIGGLGLTAPRNWTGGGKPRRELPGNWLPSKPLGNALVIPIMSDDFDSIELLKETAQTPRLLSDIRDALSGPRLLGGRGSVSFSDAKGIDRVEVEQFDIYMLVKASRAGLIPDAVQSLPLRVRPPVNAELFDFLEKNYDCPFVLGCFNNDDVGPTSKPIAYKYTPSFPGHFMIYTTDSHSGKAPELDAKVKLDHAIWVGSHRLTKGTKVHYSDAIPAALQPYVPSQVLGRTLHNVTMINGDFAVAVDDVAAGNFNAYRVSTPYGPQRERISLADLLAPR